MSPLSPVALCLSSLGTQFPPSSPCKGEGVPTRRCPALPGWLCSPSGPGWTGFRSLLPSPFSVPSPVSDRVCGSLWVATGVAGPCWAQPQVLHLLWALRCLPAHTPLLEGVYYFPCAGRLSPPPCSPAPMLTSVPPGHCSSISAAPSLLSNKPLPGPSLPTRSGTRRTPSRP